jgi:hypothetical protein
LDPTFSVLFADQNARSDCGKITTKSRKDKLIPVYVVVPILVIAAGAAVFFFLGYVFLMFSG